MLTVLMGLFNAIWATIFLYYGTSYLQTMLGGTIYFFYSLPIISSLTLFNKDYAKILWSINSTFIGIVLVNYLHSYFNIYHFNNNLLILAFMLCIPFNFIFCGYFYLILSFLISPKSKVIENSEDMKAFKYFIAYTALMITLPIILTLPLMDCLGCKKNIINNGVEIASGIFVSAILLFLYESRKISKETINYFAMPLPRITWGIEKVKIIIGIGMLIFIIFSAINELKIRQQWFIWSESIAILIANVLILLKFGQIIFMPANVQRERPGNFYFPFLKKKLITIIILSLVFSSVCELTG